MEKINKNCCVRLPANIHRRSKVFAYMKGLSLQAFITELIVAALEADGTSCFLRDSSKSFTDDTLSCD